MPRYVRHPVKGYEGLYWITKDGRVFNKHRELKPTKNPQGYMRVTLTKNEQPKQWSVHRLAVLTFLPNPENKPMVNHKNSIRHDNHLTNLEWCTHAENMAHGALARQKRRAKEMEQIKKELAKVRQKNPNGFVGGRFGVLIPQNLSLTPIEPMKGFGYLSLYPIKNYTEVK